MQCDQVVLHHHLQTKHCGHNKTEKIKIPSSECFHQSLFAEIVEAYFKIAQMIAKEEKLYKVGETSDSSHSCKKQLVLC